MTLPLCSVCIANYNGVGLIDACIESIRAQTLNADIEIIVHDDASTDGSASLVATRYPDVRLIISAENVGFCIANSRMVATARGRWLLLLNNDATLLPDALATLLAESQRVATPMILTLPQYDAVSGELLDIGSRLDPFLNAVPNVDPDAVVGMVAGACLWIDKVLWDELGGFPAWFGSLAEDLYLCCRARLAGYPVRALGSSGYLHAVGRSFGGGKPQADLLVSTFRRRALTERNKTFVMAMTYPAPFVQLLLPMHLLLLLVEGVLLSLLRVDFVYLSKIYLPVFSSLLYRRREILAVRRMAMENLRLSRLAFFSGCELWPYKLKMLLRYGLPRVS